MVGVAVGAKGGLGDPTLFNLDRTLEVADGAPEQSLVHFWHQVRHSDHHSGDGDQLVRVRSGH